MDRCCGETGGKYMLKKFSLRNYKNFKDEVSLDFCDTAGYQFNNDCITDGIISKMLIYGRNATGKTNLGRALVDIFYILFGGLWHMEEGAFLHADSVEDAAVFSYTFQFEKHEVVYQYARFANYELKEEKLFLNNEMIYACDFLQEQYDFEHLSAIDVETASTERYRQSLSHFAGEAEEETEYQIPFLRWCCRTYAFFCRDCISGSLDNCCLSSTCAYGLGRRWFAYRRHDRCSRLCRW